MSTNKYDFKLLTSEKAIDAALKDISARGASLQMDIHIAACSVMQHLIKHGNIGIVHKMLNALPESNRTNALRKWFEHYGPVVFSGNDPVYSKAKIENKQVKLGEAMQTPFWKLKANEGGDYEPVDVTVEINRLVNKLNKDAEKTGRDHSPVIAALRGAAKPAYVPEH